MASPDSKSAKRRAELVELVSDHILAHGIAESSLRALAKGTGVSDRMLLYYFTDKAEMMAAALERIAARLTDMMAPAAAPIRLPLAQLRRELQALLFSDVTWPYMRIWLEVASLAARDDPFYRAVGGQIARGFLDWGAAHLESHEPERDAARLLVHIEGVLLLKSVGLDDVCDLA